MCFSVQDIVVSNGIAYLIDYDDGLMIFDVKNPSEIRLLGQYSEERDYIDMGYVIIFSLQKIVLDNNLIYICKGFQGLSVISYSKFLKFSTSRIIALVLSSVGIIITGVIIFYDYRKIKTLRKIELENL